MTLSRYDKYMGQARDLLAEGFGTKKDQDTARATATRAYEEVRKLVMDAYCAIPHEQRTNEQTHLYWAMPSYPHLWREKFADAIRANLPEVACHIAPLQEAVTLTATIKATPVVIKPKAAPVINPGDKTQLRGHCQCCGRVHAASGYVAKHGYTVNYGFFNGVCPGHRYLPLEKDRSAADRSANAMDHMAVRLLRQAKRLKEGKTTPTLVRVGHGIDAKTVEFAEAPRGDQDQAIKAAIWNAERQAHELPRMAQQLRELANRVFGQPLLIVKV